MLRQALARPRPHVTCSLLAYAVDTSTAFGFFHSTSLSCSDIALRSSPPSNGSNSAASPLHILVRSRDDTYAWNLAIRGRLGRGNSKGAILEYVLMRRAGVPADSHTVGFVVKGCCGIVGGWEGQQVHCSILRMGFDSELVVQTALLNMYSLFGDVCLARRMFDETPRRDLPMWNAMLTAYTRRGFTEEAIQVVRAMGREGVRLNEVTGTSIFSAFSSPRNLKNGKVVHGYMMKNVLVFDTHMLSALINMYAKCGCLQSARCLFDLMPSKDVVSWTTMINGYSEHDCPLEALALFEDMVAEGILPDEVTMLGVISMCGKLEKVQASETVDKYVQEKGFGDSTRIMNALMLMHAKCGNIRRSCQIFDHMEIRTIVSWTTIIQGLAIHGRGLEALIRFTQVQRAGHLPDEICFLGILSACNHSNMVEEGKQCFKSMIEEHKMTPWMEHYGCMVDMLCRNGLVNEAFEFLVNMPMKPDSRMWRAFLAACKELGNIDLATKAIDRAAV